MTKPKLCIECVHGGGAMRMPPEMGQRPDQVADPGQGQDFFVFAALLVRAAHRLIQPQEVGPVGLGIFAQAQLPPADGPHCPFHRVAAVDRRAVRAKILYQSADLFPGLGGGGQLFLPWVQPGSGRSDLSHRGEEL